MPSLITFWRILVYAWKNLMRNAWLGVATVFVLVLAMLSVNVLVGVNALADRAVNVLEERVDLSVFFKPDTPDAVLEQARFFMASLSQVKDVRLLKPDESLAAFREIHADDPDILAALEELGENPLGASLIIKASRIDQYPFLIEALQNPQFDFAIEEKSYNDHSESITRVREIGESARFIGGIMIAIFAFFSVLIVSNAIRVAIYTQREEIGIMRLVGASGAFVRAPFVVEGMMLSVIALIVTTILIATIITALEPRVASLFGGNNSGLRDYFITHLPLLIFIEGGGLLALISLSSWASVGKYLKK